MASGKKSRKGADGSNTKSTGVRSMLRGNGTRPPRPSSVEDLYEGRKIHPQYIDDKAVYAWFQNRHRKGLKFIDDEGYYRLHGHEWKVPYGVRQALTVRLNWPQIANKYPFYVSWVSPKTGKRLKKYFMSMPHAIIFVAERAQYVDPEACVVSKHGYYIPPKLRGKFPRHMGGRLHYWCPCCMAPRRFFRESDRTFYAMKKFWNEEKGKYDWKDVQLALVSCAVCGITNQNTKFRASNQPYEVRKFKQGVRRARRRR